jgi:hypothetical protein
MVAGRADCHPASKPVSATSSFVGPGVAADVVDEVVVFLVVLDTIITSFPPSLRTYPCRAGDVPAVSG